MLLLGYFVGNGEDGLHLLWSPDGFTWHAVREGSSILRPDSGGGLGGLMRGAQALALGVHPTLSSRIPATSPDACTDSDPSLALGPDGTFHLVWTTSWTGRSIGYARSRDLINWSPQEALELMSHEPGTRNCWAPELIYHEQRCRNDHCHHKRVWHGMHSGRSMRSYVQEVVACILGVDCRRPVHRE